MPEGFSNNNKPSSIEELAALTNADMQKVNELILGMAAARTELIPQISNYLVNSGGKRLRPILTIASARLFGYARNGAVTENNHCKLATAVEFMHTATLLHDDVVDESDMRRGKTTARTIWGNQATILVGDFLLGQAFKLMVDVGSLEALAVLANAACVIAEGEVMQLSAAKSFNINKTEYFNIINAKTAQLFSAATEAGAIIANGSAAEIEAMRLYGQKLGIAFQLVDDILDYSGNASTLGKNLGDDFRDGKLTLPAILCLEKCSAKEREFWRKAMCEGQNDDNNLAKATELLTQYEALKRSIDYAKAYGQQAKEALLTIGSPCDVKMYSALLDVVDFCIERVN